MRVLLPFVLCCLFVTANASDWRGTVSYIKAQTHSKTVLFKLSDDIDNPARCNEKLMYAIDMQSPGGAQIFELIKYAYLNQLTVAAKSLHTCDLHRKAEGVKELVLQ